MSIFNKCYEYARLRQKGVKIKSALQVFKNPLCELDYILITFIIAFALLAITYHYREEIDNYRAEYSHKYAQERSQRVKSDLAMQRYENLLIAGLNGGYIRVDGALRSIKLCDASGTCK